MTITPSNVNNYDYFEAVGRRYWDTKYFFDTFDSNPVTSAVGGGAATGVAGDNNALVSRLGNIYEWFVIGTQTILAPKIDSFGLNLASQDATAGDGIELCQGILSNCPAAFVIGTDQAFAFRATFKVQDASGCNPLIIGLRKAAAFDATLSNYTDFVSIGIVGTANPNTIKIQTQIATGGVVTTDTTQTWADGATHSLAILVDENGVVTYQLDSAEPTVVAAYTFADALQVIPFIRFTQAADITTQASCGWYELGYQQ
jgi:hypothetical protein